jgi:beta-N-acetylglucosaminidase
MNLETKQNLMKRVRWMQVLIGGLIVVNGFLLYKVNDLTNQYNEVQVELKESREASKEVLAMLKDIRNEQKSQGDKLNSAMNITYKKRINKHNVLQLKTNGYSEYTDLGANSSISVEDMNRIIDYYESTIGKTGFSGHGSAFIKAAEATGLNPIYIYAHASVESGYGTSYLARTRHNYFGINAVDSDPGKADIMGSSVDEGIMAGAMWIKKHYYSNGYTTLASMQAAGYASNPKWSSEIVSVANSAIEAL